MKNLKFNDPIKSFHFRNITTNFLELNYNFLKLSNICILFALEKEKNCQKFFLSIWLDEKNKYMYLFFLLWGNMYLCSSKNIICYLLWIINLNQIFSKSLIFFSLSKIFVWSTKFSSTNNIDIVRLNIFILWTWDLTIVWLSIDKNNFFIW